MIHGSTPAALGLVSETAKCPICSSAERKNQQRLEGYQKGTFFDILFCPSCDTAYVSQRESANQIYDLIYKNAAVIGGYHRYQQFHKEIKTKPEPLAYLAGQESVYWTISKAIQDGIIRREHRILEVGCGLGYLTYALCQEGYNATGIDISPEAIRNAEQYYGPYYRAENIFGLSERAAERYDVVIMTELIEHLEAPIEFLNEIRKILVDKGIVLITTPNRSFLHARQITWQSDLPPVHFWWFSEQAVPHIASQLHMRYSLLSFEEYNRKTGNYGLVINSKLLPRVPTFDESGRVIDPVSDGSPLMKLALQSWKRLKRVLLPFLSRDLRRNQTLGFILINDIHA